MIRVGDLIQDPAGLRPRVTSIHDCGQRVYVTYADDSVRCLSPDEAEAWRMPVFAEEHGFTWREDL